MADTISSTQLANYHHCPPIKYDRGGGDIERYVVVLDSADISIVEVWKEETYGSGFTEQDSTNKPNLANNVRALSVSVLSNEIHIATQEVAATSHRVARHIYNMSSEGWTTTDEQVFAGDTNSTTEHCGIIAISSSNVIVVFQGTTRNNKGTRYESASYSQWNGSTWSSETEFDDAATGVHYKFPQITYDGSAKAHLVYNDGTNVQHKSLTISGLSLSSAEAVDDNTPNLIPSHEIVHYTASSTSRAVASWKRDSDGHVYVSFIDSDGTPGAEQDAGDSAIIAQRDAYRIAADDSNDEIYIVYADSATSDLWYVKYDGTWNAEVEIHDAATVGNIGGASVFDDGGLTLGILYDNGGTVTYLEVSLGGGTTLTPTAATLTLQVSSPALAINVTPTESNITLQAQNPTLATNVIPIEATVTLSSSIGSATIAYFVTPTEAIATLQASSPTLALVITPIEAIVTLQVASPTLAIATLIPIEAILTLQTTSPTLAITLTPTEATVTLLSSVGAVLQGVILTPTAAIVTLAVSSPTLLLNIIPTEAIVTLQSTSPTLVTTISAIEASLTLNAVSPTLAITLTPIEAILTVSTTSPALAIAITPTEALLTLTAASPTLAVTLTPTEAIVFLQSSLGAAITAGDVTLTPIEAIVNLQASSPTLAVTLTPTEAILTLASVSPSLAVTLTPTEAIVILQSSISTAFISYIVTPIEATLTLAAASPSLDISLISIEAVLTFSAASPTLAITLTPTDAIIYLISSISNVIIPPSHDVDGYVIIATYGGYLIHVRDDSYAIISENDQYEVQAALDTYLVDTYEDT